MPKGDTVNLVIRVANASEAEALSTLALRSKAYRGYDDKFIQDCVVELTYSPAEIESVHSLYKVALIDEVIVGFYALIDMDRPAAWLDALFIAPENIGQGIGKRLFSDMLKHAIQSGVKSVEVKSDPNALAFYLSMGMQEIGYVPSGVIPGRTLPKLKLTLD
jgi:N-acetylglutamate synthase-like GNAT family acetyltransferase